MLHMEDLSSPTRDRICIPCTARWILFFFLQSGFLIAGQPGKSPAYFKGLKNQKYVLGPTFFHIYKQILM